MTAFFVTIGIIFLLAAISTVHDIWGIAKENKAYLEESEKNNRRLLNLLDVEREQNKQLTRKNGMLEQSLNNLMRATPIVKIPVQPPAPIPNTGETGDSTWRIIK